MFLKRLWRCLYLAFAIGAPLPAWAQPDESPAVRRERVEAMTDEEKAELRRKQETFTSLPDSERERIRRLHAELAASDDGNRLQEVLERYHAWLATLSSAEKAEVLALPPEKRVEKIRAMLQKQEDERFRKDVSDKLTREDREAIIKWLREFVEENKQEIEDAAPKESRDNRVPLFVAMLRGWGDANPKMPRPTPQDIQNLFEKLSPGAQETLKSAKDPQGRIELAQRWIRAAVFSHRWWTPPPVSKEDLRKFYAETLSVSERERLEALAPHEMQQQLQRMYYEDRMRNQRGGPPRGRGGSPGSSQRGRDDDRRKDDDRRGDDEDRPSEEDRRRGDNKRRD